jgi:hypothetical protein
MGVISKLKELLGGNKVYEPLSDYERLTRATVRTANLDWQGLPIDRDAGAPTTPSRWLKRHRERVGGLLERVGMRIEGRGPPRGVQAVAGLNIIGAVFNRDAERQATDYYRRQRGGVPLVGAGRQYTVPDHLE